MQVSRVCLLFREQSPKKTCKNKGAKANSNAKAHWPELEVQADSACVSAASFRAELGGQLSSYAPSIGCALLDEAALAAAAGRLAELESTVFSSAPTTFWSLPRAWWKLHFQLPCGNFCSAAACPEGHRSALSIASHSSGVELSTRLPKQDFLFVPWPARCAKRTPAS